VSRPTPSSSTHGLRGSAGVCDVAEKLHGLERGVSRRRVRLDGTVCRRLAGV
jgi:hypothetical protein